MIHHIRTAAKKVWASIALLSIDLIILIIVFLIGLSGFLFIADRIFLKHKFKFDQEALQYVIAHVSSINTNIMVFFTFLGTHEFLIPANILLILYFLFIKKHRWYSIKVPVVAISSLLLMTVLKLSFHRARPDDPLLFKAAGYSFPSGHAFMSMTFYGILIYLVWQHFKNPTKKWILTIILAAFIFLIGISRIYLRVHYASDVMAGYSLGLAWLLLSLFIVKRIETFTLRKLDPIVETGPYYVRSETDELKSDQ
jgi:membrane-associated phospholipid phosphatase